MKKLIEYLLLALLCLILSYLLWFKSSAFFNNIANRYYEDGLFEKALRFYSLSIKIHPKSWVPHLGLANTYSSIGNYNEAINEYNIALKMYPLDSDAFNSLVGVYCAQGNYQKAINLIKNNSSLSEESSAGQLQSVCKLYFLDALKNSIELFMDKKVKEAIELLSDPLKECPAFPDIYYHLAVFYFADSDRNNSIIYLKKTLEEDIGFVQAYKLLGNIYFDQGDFNSAVYYLSKVLDYDSSQDPLIYNEIGLALMNLERYKEAATFMKKATELDPGNKYYIYSLGSIYRDNGEIDKAFAQYKILIQLQPDFTNLHNDLGDLYLNSGKRDKALEEFKKEIQYSRDKLKINPDNPEVLNSYAYALNASGESSKAKAIVEKIISSYPYYLQAYLTLVSIYEKSGDKKNALLVLEKAKKFYPHLKFIDLSTHKLKKGLSLENINKFVVQDRIHLENGRKLEGKIKYEDNEKVILSILIGSSAGEITINKNSIKAIERLKKEDYIIK